MNAKPTCLALLLLAACSSTSNVPTDRGEQITKGEVDAGPPTPTPGNDAAPPPLPAPAQSPSGEKLCSASTDCAANLACEHSTAGTSGVCVSACKTGADCAAGHDCISGPSIGFPASCMKQCESVADCAGGMGCFQIGSGTEKACLPNDWAAPQKGLGDSCTTDADCSVGTCNGKWCTKQCAGASATECPGIHNGRNENGEYNDCVRANDGKSYCFPECWNSASSCGDYPGTTCGTGTTYYGNSVKVCSM